jgi:hypothetical protein
VVHNFLRTRTGRYRIVDPPGSSPDEEVVDINNRGELVGFVDDNGENTVGTRGFLRTRGGRYVTIAVPGAASTLALKANDRSQVAGSYIDRAPTGTTPPVHGFVWHDGEVTTIDHPDAANGTFVFGINDRGDTVGFYDDAAGNFHGFLRDRRGRIESVDAPGAELGTQPAAINDRGETVGAAVNADGSTDAFRRDRTGRFTIIEAPGEATYTRALDINDRGDIVGDYDTEPATSTVAAPSREGMVSFRTGDAAGPLGVDRGIWPGAGRHTRHPGDASGAFVYRQGRYTPLGKIPGAAPIDVDVPGFPGLTTASTHFANNDRGDIAGIYASKLSPGGLPEAGSSHGFVQDRRGAVTDFDAPGGGQILVKGINNRGQVTGEYIDASVTAPGPDGLLPPGTVHGFVRDPDGTIATFDVPFPYLHDIGDINDRGQIVGYYNDPDRPLNLAGGFLRQPDGRITRIDVPRALETTPRCIDNRGRVYGDYIDAGATLNPDGTIPPNVIHGFVWHNGRFTTVDPHGSALTFVAGCNDRGDITGGYQDARGEEHGFLHRHGRTVTLDAPGRIDNIAWGINNHGDIVIPEPTVRLAFQVAST